MYYILAGLRSHSQASFERFRVELRRKFRDGFAPIFPFRQCPVLTPYSGTDSEANTRLLKSTMRSKTKVISSPQRGSSSKSSSGSDTGSDESLSGHARKIPPGQMPKSVKEATVSAPSKLEAGGGHSLRFRSFANDNNYRVI